MQRLKIDLRKITGAKHFTAKDGTDHIAFPVAANNIYVGDKGSYMELTLMDNMDGKDQYDNDGFIVLGISKERREAGEKGPILGNWKHVEIRTQSHSSNQPKQTGWEKEDADDDTTLPF